MGENTVIEGARLAFGEVDCHSGLLQGDNDRLSCVLVLFAYEFQIGLLDHDVFIVKSWLNEDSLIS